LSEQGIDTEDESAKLSENELLMEVMEAREAIDDAQSEADLVAPREENNARIEGSIQKLDQAFAQGDLENAAKEAIKLRYWMNIDQSIQGWEEGQGGGAIHH
jgi:molecular chaperone HscB